MDSIVPWITIGTILFALLLANHFWSTKAVLLLGGLILWLGPTYLSGVLSEPLLNLGLFQMTGLSLVLGMVFSFFVASFTRTSEQMDKTIGSFWSRLLFMMLAFILGCALTILLPTWWQGVISKPTNSTAIP